MEPELRAFWPSFQWADNAWITDRDGAPLQKRAYPSFTKQLLSEVDLSFQGYGTFHFQKPVSSGARLSADGLETIAQWIWTLIVNIGIHTADVNGIPAAHRVYSIQRHPVFDKYEWQIASGGALLGSALDQKWNQRANDGEIDQISARVAGWGCPVQFTAARGSETVQDDLQRLQAPDDGLVVLAGHPQVHHGPVLTRIHHRLQRPLDKVDLQAALRPSPTQVRQLRRQGVQLICGRLERTRHQHPELFGALQSSTPRQLTAANDGLSLYQQLFRYRLILGVEP